MITNLVLAGQHIEVHSVYDLFSYMCQDYCISIQEKEEYGPPLSIKVNTNDIINEYNRDEKENLNKEGDGQCFFNPRVYDINAARRKIANELLAYNVFLMHGSVVSYNNWAYMFTAPSGTGKTTRTSIWLKEFPSSTVVNGDKPFIKVTDKTIYACGSPWCGKEGWNSNVMVPLRAIFLLERANNNCQNSVEKISLSNAFPFLYRQVFYPDTPDKNLKTIELLKCLEGKVGIYTFRSAPTSEAIRLAYETVNRTLD